MSVINVKKHTTLEVETPQLNRTSIYIKTDNSLAWKDDTGAEHVAATGISPEEVQDIIGSTMTDSATIDFVYNDAGNQIYANVIQSAIDHGSIAGLGDDDHTQYLNNTRGDARYYTKTQLDAGQLDNRYYTETEVNSSLSTKINTSEKGIANGVATLDATVKIPVAQIPALPYAPTSHTHTASQITDFTSAVQAVGNTLYSSVNHTHADATPATSGFMSAADKSKLDGLVNDVVMITNANVSNSSNTTFSSLDQLALTVVAGRVYAFEFLLRFQTAANTTGIGMSVGGTASGSLTANANAISGTGTAGLYSGPLTALNGVITTSGVPSANTPYLARITGIFIATNSGFIRPQFRSEINGSAVTVLANSVGTFKEIQ